MSQPAPQATSSAPAEPVPVAFLGRTSTLVLQTWDTAQTAGAEHASSRDDPGLASHPARRSYVLRSRCRCRDCKRRMRGILIRPHVGHPGYVYYGCPPGLLDALPMLGDALPDLPAHIQAKLYAAFGLELIYNKHDHQVTIYATITPSTPQALAGIIADSEPPTAPAELAHSPQHPRT
jgi:hypothetical protein